jgi:DNA sulfur modification protein DndD
MREERVNRRITESIENIPLEPLRQFLKDRLRFERSKMDRDQPYFKNSYREATEKYLPEDPSELEGYDATTLTKADGDQISKKGLSPESPPIQIHEVRLKNWRQYGGEQVVDLNAKDNRLINVIEGQNGAGKSNFLNAITLCFYGKQVQKQTENTDFDSQPFVTFSKVKDADIGESETGFIEIVLGIDEPEYRFRREFSTTKQEDGTYEDSIDELELRRKKDNEWVFTDNPSNYLNEVLPARVADYFLFDGEDLDVFFEEGYADRVEDAILDVSHLELLNRAIDHLEKIRYEFESEATDVEGEINEIREELEGVNEELQRHKKKHEDIESTIEDTKAQIDEIEAKLMDLSDDYVQELYELLDDKQDQVKKLETRLEEIRADIKDLLTSLGPALYAAEALLDAMDHLDEISDAGSLPPRIQRRFVSELIKDGECICGRPIEEHSEEQEELEALKQSVFDVSDTQLTDNSVIPTIFEQTDEKMEILIEKRKTAADIEDEIDSLKQEIQNTRRELEAYEIPDVDTEALENNRNELEEELTDLRNRRARLEVEIEDLEDEKDEIQAELDDEIEKKEENKEILAKISLVELSIESLSHMRENILSEIRERTESNMTTYVNQLIWKDEHYDIHLGEDYSVQVWDEYDENKIGSLSAGETQVLALSFMAALSQISGFEAPVVIDTPLGRISSGPRREIAKNLPEYMSDTQITFLMTDEEYTAEVRDLMAPSVGREYRLVFEDNETQIVDRDELQEVEH